MAAVAYPLTHERLRPAPEPVRPGPSPRPRVARPVPPGTYARRRAAAVLLVAALVVAIRLLLGALGGGPLTAPEPISVPGGARLASARVVVVQPGDTLWSIARRLDTGGDVRVTVQRLAAAHGGSVLQVGERIRLP